jgi:hypothetical protein
MPRAVRHPPRAKPTSRTWFHGRHWYVALIVASVCAASIAGIGNDFVGDDRHIIVTDPRVQDLSHWREWWTQAYWPPPFSPDLYRPLTTTMLAIENLIGAGTPMIFRVVSYALCAAASISLYSLCRRFVPDKYALAAAVLFAVHPVHVEAIAAAVNQNELLVGWIAIAMATRYLDARRDGEISFRDWALLTAMYAVACLSKEQGFVLPALLLAVELCFVTAPFRERMRALWRGFATFAAIALLIVIIRRQILGDLRGSFIAEALLGLSFKGRLLTMLGIVPHWFRLFIWPMHLRADYSPQEITAASAFGSMQLLGSALILCSIALAWRYARREPAITFGLLWTGIALLPVSNLFVPTGIVIAERTLFLPSVGFVIAIVAAVHRVVSRRAGDAMPRSVTIGVGVLAVLAIARSAERQLVWRNEGYFVARGVQDSPRSFRMQQGLGDLLYGADQPVLGREAYDRALRYVPASSEWRVRNDLAKTLASRGDIEGDAAQLRLSLLQNPDQEFSRGLLIDAYLALGRYRDARAEADSALAHGASASVFESLRAVADSAARESAPVGSVRVRLHSGQFRANRDR